MKRLLVACCILLLVTAQQAGAWGNLTHVSIIGPLGVETGSGNMHEIYGSVLTDMFNYELNAQGAWMSAALHGGFAALGQNARTCDLRAVFFGIASHNDVWGCDFTAHHPNNVPPADDGYAITKGAAIGSLLANDLRAIILAARPDIPAEVADPLVAYLALEFGHDLSETAVDILLRQYSDPTLGAQLAYAAKTRPAGVAKMLADTYAAPLAAATGIPYGRARSFIITTEHEYQKQMMQYGMAFTLPPEQTIGALAMQFAVVAEMYIEGAMAGASYPGDATVDPAQVAGFIFEAMAVVEPDFGLKVENTLVYVRGMLELNHISSCSSSFAKGSGDAEEIGIAGELPKEVALDQNYPNPFNPVTVISFQVPKDGMVSLRVYDLLGREVATLVNEQRSAGRYTERFDGSSLASGMYLYRLEAAGITQVRRMVLAK